MDNELLTDFDNLIIQLKNKPAANPMSRMPKWVMECQCRGCKRFRKRLKNEKPEKLIEYRKIEVKQKNN